MRLRQHDELVSLTDPDPNEVMEIDKAEVLAELRQRISDQLESVTSSQRAAQSGAVHEETRQENPKDTRAIEAQYLARGLATRVATLRRAASLLATMELKVFDRDAPIALSAIVVLLDEEDRQSVHFLSPAAGGESLRLRSGQTIQSLTLSSPLGSALVGKLEGDEIEVELPGGWVRAWIQRVI